MLTATEVHTMLSLSLRGFQAAPLSSGQRGLFFRLLYLQYLMRVTFQQINPLQYPH